MAERGQIRIGIGGWNYAPWRTTFYPPGTRQRDELAYAGRQLTAIEVNGTFYRLQNPDSFTRWHDETPPAFMFSLKAPRHVTGRRDLRTAGESLHAFLDSGIDRLGSKLGPLVWQLPPTKTFDADEIDAFLHLLPATVNGLALRHVLEVRHRSFLTEDYVSIARRHRVATVYTDSDEYPSFADLSGDFVYLRLMRAQASIASGYEHAALHAWAERVQRWAAGKEPDDLPRIAPRARRNSAKDVFLFFINGAKERAPAAAQALLALITASARVE